MYIYIIFAKLITGIIRVFGLGGATSLPGLILEKYFPDKIEYFFKPYKKIIFITGTNGKTTTQRCLRHLIELKGKRVVSNKSGANLLRGIISSLIVDRNVFAKAKSDICIFEVEEATMPILTKYVKPSFILITNLFRDQLDAYGEITKVRNDIVQSVKNSPRSILFLNEDDPSVCSISSEVKNKSYYFFIKDRRKKEIFYEKSAHMNKIDTNAEVVYACRIKIDNDLSSYFDVHLKDKKYRGIRFESPGIMNVYNAVLAIFAADKIIKYSESEIVNAFSTYKVAFGRGEVIKIGSKYIRLLLIKNPASLSLNLDMLKNQRDLKLMIILNDNTADGRDISWIWDANFKVISKTSIASLIVSGKRAYDMNIRLKYADINAMSKEVEPVLSHALDLALSMLNDEETLYILATYTGMLEIRKVIGGIVNLRKFWK